MVVKPSRRRAVSFLVCAVVLGSTAISTRPVAVALSPDSADFHDQASLPTIYIPMIVRRQDVAHLPPPPTAPPTDPPPVQVPLTPSDTPTPTVTLTPTAPPTATPMCAALAERVEVTRVGVEPASVDANPGRQRGGSQNRPILISPLPDGGAKVAWSDSGGTVHITPLDSDGARRGADVTAGKGEVRGFVAHDDGAALLRGQPDDMWLTRLDAKGKTVFEKQLGGARAQSQVGSKWIDDWGHEGRLVWGGDRYAAYFGHTQMFGGGKGKHQGDLLWLFDEKGNKQSGGWDWGCSHSLDVRLAHNGTRFGPVCLSDCYPSKAIHFNHSLSEIRREPSGDCSGGSTAGLGGLVPVADGFVLTFTSREGRESSDVGMVHVSNDGKVGPVKWLTGTSANESGAHLARFGRRFLAGWIADNRYTIAEVGADGGVAGRPVTIDARFAAQDDWTTFATGDVGWAHAWDDLTELKVVRVKACQEEEADATNLTKLSRSARGRR